jgi:hypothetical protein
MGQRRNLDVLDLKLITLLIQVEETIVTNTTI